MTNTSTPGFLRCYWNPRPAILLGAAAGLCLRLLMGSVHTVTYAAGLVLTVGFLAFGPFAVGYLTVAQTDPQISRRVWYWIFAPWLSLTIAGAVTAVLNLEGAICIVFALPIAFFFGSLGGIAAGLVARRARRRQSVITCCVLLLPLVSGAGEARRNPPGEIRTVHTEIVIHAPAAVVWRHIERVRPISRAELPRTWVQEIGFPRPIEATLSYEGVGGVRHASFARGLLFVETITTWQPDRDLAFTIHAAKIPRTTLDEHATIGGPYFDVLTGEYRLSPLRDGSTLLLLTSRERLSTDLNPYAGAWTDAVMRSIQSTILQVIRHRCEAATPVLEPSARHVPPPIARRRTD